MPKLKITIAQYLWCWAIVLIIYNTPISSDLGISGVSIYLYKGSISFAAIYLLLKNGSSSYLTLILSIIELLAVLLQIGACLSHALNEPNWFYLNYKALMGSFFQLEIMLLVISGIYGFGLLIWNACNSLPRDRGRNSLKSFIYSLFFEERRGQRR